MFSVTGISKDLCRQHRVSSPSSSDEAEGKCGSGKRKQIMMCKVGCIKRGSMVVVGSCRSVAYLKHALCASDTSEGSKQQSFAWDPILRS